VAVTTSVVAIDAPIEPPARHGGDVAERSTLQGVRGK